MSNFHKGPRYSCPNCKRSLDTHFSASGQKPRAGDMLVCAYCVAALEFQDDGYRMMTETDIDALDEPSRRDLKQAVLTVQLLKARRQGGS